MGTGVIYQDVDTDRLIMLPPIDSVLSLRSFFPPLFL